MSRWTAYGSSFTSRTGRTVCCGPHPVVIEHSIRDVQVIDDCILHGTTTSAQKQTLSRNIASINGEDSWAGGWAAGEPAQQCLWKCIAVRSSSAQQPRQDSTWHLSVQPSELLLVALELQAVLVPLLLLLLCPQALLGP